MRPVYIAGAGLVSPLGSGLAATKNALLRNQAAIAPLDLFPLLQNKPLPVGQARDLEDGPLPRTHLLARKAAAMAMRDCPEPPDAVLLGCTTGGILTTERLLREGEEKQEAYRYHSLTSVAEDLAGIYHCDGPAFAFSTACSSGAMAIAVALQLLRRGAMQRILVGGVDSLCRLTYFGFHALQLVDSRNCRPFDLSRRGLNVAEAASFLLLSTVRPEQALAQVLGAGISCDAHHPTAPHPEGRGALEAMQTALADAGLAPNDIDYISLHGTATIDNDRAEAKAICTLFPQPPPLSSIKGATGHSLAASGALEAAVAGLCIAHDFIPGTTGCLQPDPALELQPQLRSSRQPVSTVLSNSFGFGGNNVSLALGRANHVSNHRPPSSQETGENDALAIHGYAALSGAGLSADTLKRWQLGKSAAGCCPSDQLTATLPAKLIRRLHRLPRMALALAREACPNEDGRKISAVFLGTAWGALSETWNFLDGLRQSEERFPSPTDFIASVHNAPAAQVALLFQATGANITVSGGNASFEQALLCAQTMLKPEENALLLGLDEAHARFSPLLDDSFDAKTQASMADGGGCFCLSRPKAEEKPLCLIRLRFLASGQQHSRSMEALLRQLGGAERIANDYAAVLAGIPSSASVQATQQLDAFMQATSHQLPLCPYRQYTGNFSSASALGAVMAASFVSSGAIPAGLAGKAAVDLWQDGKKLLLLGTGKALSAMEFFRP